MKKKSFKNKITKLHESLYLIDDFFSPRECANLIKIASNKGLLEYHEYYDAEIRRIDQTKKDKFNSVPIGHNKTTRDIEKRIEELTLIPVNHGEPGKIMHYEEGAKKRPHWDTNFGKNTGLGDCENRTVTVMVYLNDVIEGGETNFPLLGIKVIPKKGRCVLMYNAKGCRLPEEGETKFFRPKKLVLNKFSFHAGGKIYEGEKWIYTKFLHENIFDLQGRKIRYGIPEKK